MRQTKQCWTLKGAVCKNPPLGLGLLPQEAPVALQPQLQATALTTDRLDSMSPNSPGIWEKLRQRAQPKRPTWCACVCRVSPVSFSAGRSNSPPVASDQWKPQPLSSPVCPWRMEVRWHYNEGDHRPLAQVILIPSAPVDTVVTEHSVRYGPTRTSTGVQQQNRAQFGLGRLFLPITRPQSECQFNNPPSYSPRPGTLYYIYIYIFGPQAEITVRDQAGTNLRVQECKPLVCWVNSN